MNLHIEYCKEFGLSPQDLQREEESQGEIENNLSECELNILAACTAYTRHVAFLVELQLY